MIESFEQMKKELIELSDVINSFKSEAVQLRIMELLLQGSANISILETQRTPRETKGRPMRKQPEVTSKPSRVGAATALNQLMDKGFFKKRHTAQDILSHCNSRMGLALESKNMSSALKRFVNDGRLKRKRNDKGLYEYFTG